MFNGGVNILNGAAPEPVIVDQAGVAFGPVGTGSVALGAKGLEHRVATVDGKFADLVIACNRR